MYWLLSLGIIGIITGWICHSKNLLNKSLIHCFFYLGFFLIIVSAISITSLIDFNYDFKNKKFSFTRGKIDKTKQNQIIVVNEKVINQNWNIIVNNPNLKISKKSEPLKQDLNLNLEKRYQPEIEKEINNLIKSVIRNPDKLHSPEDYLIKATQALYFENYEETIKFCNLGLNLSPKGRVKATFHATLGAAFGNLSNDSIAIKHFEKAINLDPKFSGHYNAIGGFYLFKKSFEKAEINFKKSLALNSNDATTYNNLGLLYLDQRRFEEAKFNLEIATILDPNLGGAFINLGILYSLQSNLNKAKEIFTKAIELPNFAPLANFNLGLLFLFKGQTEEAEKAFRKTIELNSNLSFAHGNLAFILFYQKNLRKQRKNSFWRLS